MRIDLKSPYLCQYDNELFPLGTCNMTSLAMAMGHYGIHVPGPYVRASDNLTNYCNVAGLDRHVLTDIEKVSEHFGLTDDASYTDSIDDVKAHLAKGDLVIVQGTFTPSGHVILVVGFDDIKGVFICNDPAGYYPHYSHNWLSGENVEYPSVWFREHAAPDGLVWAHLLSHPSTKVKKS